MRIYEGRVWRRIMPLSRASSKNQSATLPADWQSIQSRWQRWHTIRTFLSIAAVVAATISAAVMGRPNQPPSSVVPPGRAVARDGSA
jgi:hypothetical protein